MLRRSRIKIVISCRYTAVVESSSHGSSNIYHDTLNHIIQGQEHLRPSPFWALSEASLRSAATDASCWVLRAC